MGCRGSKVRILSPRPSISEEPPQTQLSPVAKPIPPEAASPARSATAWRDEPYRQLVESAPYAIILLDTDGRVASWNRGAQQILGFTAIEIVGKPFTTFYPHAAIEKGWPAHELDTAKRLGRFEDE